MKTVDDEGHVTIWWYFIGLPLMCLFLCFHFVVCTFLTIFVYPKERRHKIYEYYAPWGWGRRSKDETPDD